MRKAGALANEVIIGAGDVLKIFSELMLDSTPSSSSVKLAVGMTGPGAVSNGLSHVAGQEVGVPLVSKH